MAQWNGQDGWGVEVWGEQQAWTAAEQQAWAQGEQQAWAAFQPAKGSSAPQPPASPPPVAAAPPPAAAPAVTAKRSREELDPWPTKKARFGGIECQPLAPGEVRRPTGEIRFDMPDAAQQAMLMSHSIFTGKGGESATVEVTLDERSKDLTKIYIHGLPHETEWQELKDFFATCGRIAYAGVIGGKGAAPAIAEVRYNSADEAQMAINLFHEQIIEGSQLTVKHHHASKDGTKLQVFGLPPETEWQELKDYFGQAGHVVFVDIVTKEKMPPGAFRQGEVRYETPEHAQQAVAKLNGTTLGGAQMIVDFDMNSTDGSKLIVRNVPIGIEWQEMKDHFLTIGPVAFCQVNTIGPNGEIIPRKGKGKGFGKMPMPGMMMHHMPGAMNSWQMGMDMGKGRPGPMNGWQMGGMDKGKGPCMMGGNVGMMGCAHGMMGCPPPMMMGDGPGMNGNLVGEVRFETPMHAQSAIAMLDGSVLNGAMIQIKQDMLCKDGSRILVSGIKPGTPWQALKDHFGVLGTVAFANIKGQPKGGKGMQPMFF